MPNFSPTCVDANLVVRLVAEPRDEPVWRHWRAWDAAARLFSAPLLLRYEVTNALFRAERTGLRSANATRLALQTALRLPIRFHDDSFLHLRAMELASRFRLPAAYDAHYLAFADYLGAELWTAHRRPASAVAHALPWVHLVG